MFYDPLVETAGPIAEEYGISISDVLGLLLQAGKDEALVRRLLAESKSSEAALEMARLGQPFDLVQHARLRLQQTRREGTASSES
ncbi:MAG TPA: hypothetical protein VND68_11665 [Chloroflexia bacterium]|nr:hypothetical protein [Chloroflexia bacterium]